MLTLPEFFELIEHRVTGGSEFQWQCYGSQAYVIDSVDANHSFSVVFDRDDQVVYEVNVCDYVNNRAYRIINPDFKSGHDDEAAGRDVPANQAWDDILYVDLDVADDFIQKSLAIRDGKPYDTRVQLDLDLDDDLLFGLMKLAHQRDITLNQLIEQILTEMLDRTRAQKEQTES
jgi:predicted transcriptional regulator